MQALLGAMEQGEVAVAKAGICATLPARTAVLAAANPAGGAYSRAKTVHENLRLSAAMLSRFDLIFIMQARGAPLFAVYSTALAYVCCSSHRESLTGYFDRVEPNDW